MLALMKTSMAICTPRTVPARACCTSKLLRCACQLSDSIMCGVVLTWSQETEVLVQLKSRAKEQEDAITHVTQELERVRAEVCEGPKALCYNCLPTCGG